LTPTAPAPQNLTHTAGDDVQPSWCSDGTIWFASNRINGVQQIFGTTLADLLAGLRPFNFSGTHNNPREFDPSPYPGCQRLMFSSTLDGAQEIWRYFPDCEECYRKVRTYKDLGGRAEGRRSRRMGRCWPIPACWKARPRSSWPTPTTARPITN
jgi:hypothetical protein